MTTLPFAFAQKTVPGLIIPTPARELQGRQDGWFIGGLRCAPSRCHCFLRIQKDQAIRRAYVAERIVSPLQSLNPIRSCPPAPMLQNTWLCGLLKEVSTPTRASLSAYSSLRRSRRTPCRTLSCRSRDRKGRFLFHTQPIVGHYLVPRSNPPTLPEHDPAPHAANPGRHLASTGEIRPCSRPPIRRAQAKAWHAQNRQGEFYVQTSHSDIPPS